MSTSEMALERKGNSVQDPKLFYSVILLFTMTGNKHTISWIWDKSPKNVNICLVVKQRYF